MERKELEVYCEESNYGLVRMPGRRFPGCVIQGDSLASLWNIARSVYARASGLGDEELAGDAAEVVRQLESRLRHYEGF